MRRSLPKHLREMEPETVAKLQSGINAFRFGFAATGTEYEVPGGHKLVFIGDFAKRKDAYQCRDDNAGSDVQVNPYLFGHCKTGWAVWKVQDEKPIIVRRQVGGVSQKITLAEGRADAGRHLLVSLEGKKRLAHDTL